MTVEGPARPEDSRHPPPLPCIPPPTQHFFPLYTSICNKKPHVATPRLPPRSPQALGGPGSTRQDLRMSLRSLPKRLNWSLSAATEKT